MTNPLTDQSDEASGAGPSDQADALVHRLTDLLVEEVSAVDAAANRRKIVVQKRDGGDTMLGEAIHDGAEPKGQDLNWTVDVNKDTPPAAQPPAGDQGGKDAAEWDTAFVNALPDTAFLYIAPGGEKDADGMTTPRSLRFFPVRDDKGELDVPHLNNALSRIPQADIPQEDKDKAKAEAEKLLAEASPDGGSDGAEGEDKAGGAGDPPPPADPPAAAPQGGDVAKALSPVLKAMDMDPEDKARDLLWMAMDEISRGALRSEADTTAVTGLLDALRGAVTKAAAGQDGDSTDATVKAPEEVVEAVKLLQVALGRMVAGEPLDAEAHQAVDRAREILSSIATPTDDAAADPEQLDPNGEPVEDRQDQAKAGAKMSAANRAKFKAALDDLGKLFEGMIPEEQRKSWPRPETTPETPESVTKAEAKAAELETDLAKAQDRVKALNVELAKAKERPVGSNAVTVDKGTGDPGGVDWGHDLNEDD